MLKIRDENAGKKRLEEIFREKRKINEKYEKARQEVREEYERKRQERERYLNDY
ncbi:hypothetical protein [Alkalicoccus chagannorensis]|uniref:hypothetical protein n=1 Tax=Alkalicoccus chagannorensis TaxID=427072 RepID=UPI000423DC10|nr:hypothetical protein [Alkalicoccus chagannorensis]